MRLVPILAFALSTCSAGTTTHHWFAKVPVNQGVEHAKRTKYTKGFGKPHAVKGSGKAKQGAVLTRVITN